MDTFDILAYIDKNNQSNDIVNYLANIGNVHSNELGIPTTDENLERTDGSMFRKDETIPEQINPSKKKFRRINIPDAEIKQPHHYRYNQEIKRHNETRETSRTTTEPDRKESKKSTNPSKTPKESDNNENVKKISI